MKKSEVGIHVLIIAGINFAATDKNFSLENISTLTFSSAAEKYSKKLI
jgi:hypothetical protein